MPPKKKEEAAPAARFGRVRNNLKMGLVGMPNVGKSSLFNLLTAQAVASDNYPFCTIDPNESRCAVPDERYNYLCDLWDPPSKYPAYLFVTDIAGLIKGASEGAGLGNAFLSHISAVDGIFHLIRVFESDEVVHVEDSVDPVRDLETITGELCLKDLEILDRAIAQENSTLPIYSQKGCNENSGKDVTKTQGTKLSGLFTTTMEKVREMLEANRPVRTGDWSTPEVEMINEKLKDLITTKPMIYLVNLSMDNYIKQRSKWLPKTKEWIDSHGGGIMIPLSVEFEQKLWDLRDNPAGIETLLADSSGAKSVLPRIVKVGYKQLHLIYYFTAGETEVRCWTIQQGTLAPGAAGVIHSDFERGFIKAEVVAFDDFKAHSGGTASMAGVKAAGKYRQEGKTYEVKDGDIIHFQFNVTAPKKK